MHDFLFLNQLKKQANISIACQNELPEQQNQQQNFSRHVSVVSCCDSLICFISLEKILDWNRIEDRCHECFNNFTNNSFQLRFRFYIKYSPIGVDNSIYGCNCEWHCLRTFQFHRILANVIYMRVNIF